MIYALLASFFWGIMYYSNSKVVKSGVTYSQAVLFSLPLWVLVVFATKGQHKLLDTQLLSSNKVTFIVYLLSSLLGNYFIFKSLQSADVVLVATLEMTYPLFVLLLRYYYEGQKASSVQLIGVLLTLLGVVLVTKNQE